MGNDVVQMNQLGLDLCINLARIDALLIPFLQRVIYITNMNFHYLGTFRKTGINSACNTSKIYFHH